LFTIALALPVLEPRSKEMCVRELLSLSPTTPFYLT